MTRPVRSSAPWRRLAGSLPRLLGLAATLIAMLAGPCLAGEGPQAAWRASSRLDPLLLDPERTPSSRETFRYPRLRKELDLPLLAGGAGLFLASTLLTTEVDPVPPEGLDPAELSLSVDRRVVGNVSERADVASDWTVAGAIAFPLVLGLVTDDSGNRLEGLLRRGVIYVETTLVKEGFIDLSKRAISRPRPFNYISDADRPDSPAYDVTADRAFRAMPSGHSAGAWTAASVGITEHLLVRPEARPLERFAVGFVGGALAAATSTLRVEAGQHFPTDVMAGAAFGIANGVTIPLLHRGDDPAPPTRSWLEAAAGTAAGALVGVLLSSAL